MVAKLVISFDFELGWGVLESNAWRIREKSGIYSRLRQVLPILFASLKDLELPTTWAIVSSMLVENECDLRTEHLPDSYRDSVIRFFREARWETRCARDLIDKFHTVQHTSEICTHSSTHIYAEHPDITERSYIKDVADSIQVMEKYFGLETKTFVFPRDQDNYRAGIAEAFPMNFRLNPSFCYDNNLSGAFRRRIGFMLPFVPTSRVAMGRFGEIYQTGSFFFNWPEGRGEAIKKMRVVLKKDVLINRLKRGEGMYHIWLHPFNLTRTAGHLELFNEFLLDVAHLRDSGCVEVRTMASIGDACQLH